ncbi:IS110 family transposase [Gordonia terrae]|uniref:IS110 family transposase n=1 Tax=Gordonia terrae TaxID=2055 RepID=UPI00200A3012|nr:IS110 family transposase [Gordonia terrae]UPW10359.1 IS110 family transposase [Gordonia terrae]
MSKASRLSRGDKRRNDRLSRFRGIVRREFAVVAIDLAARKQVVAVVDHDSRILARRTFACTPWQLATAIEWGRTAATAAGFAGIVVACEPTGHRWKTVRDLAAAVGVDVVCVQPIAVARARETEDFTHDKSDDKDALLIARLTTQLDLYLPEHADEQWTRLRHLGVRRSQQLTRRGAAQQQVRDLLEGAWPHALDCAGQPFKSVTWLAAMSVIDCTPATLTTLGGREHAVAWLREQVRAELPSWGARRVTTRILVAVVDAAFTAQTTGEAGALERARYALADFHHARSACEQVESAMIEVLTGLGLHELAGSIPGVSPVSVAAILAETGDLTRFDSARALVKHAGLCPRENSSGNYRGTTRISGRGRPLLRVAAWRAAFAALTHNEVYADRYRHLTSRETNQLNPNQARVAIAAALLRQLFVVITTATPWNPDIAAGRTRPAERTAA